MSEPKARPRVRTSSLVAVALAFGALVELVVGVRAFTDDHPVAIVGGVAMFIVSAASAVLAGAAALLTAAARVAERGGGR